MALKKLLIFIYFSYLLVGCNKPHKKVTPAFYHWKTAFNITSADEAYLNQIGVKKLYAKVFDVDWDFNEQTALPHAIIKLDSVSTNFKIIPCIFITNRTLKNISDTGLDTLANNITQLLLSITRNVPAISNELQLDCDWTETTQQKYFNLINLLKAKLSTKFSLFSCTIRLHQVKYYQATGVPPVNKGMLMFYNMGELNNNENQNSIIDIEIAKKYFVNFDKYPLPLDVALPLYSWAVVTRKDKVIGLINNPHVEELNRKAKYNNGIYTVTKNGFYKSTMLYVNDEIRIETCKKETLMQAAELLTNQIKGDSITVSFYHLDDYIKTQHNPHEIHEILRHF